LGRVGRWGGGWLGSYIGGIGFRKVEETQVADNMILKEEDGDAINLMGLRCFQKVTKDGGLSLVERYVYG